MKVFVTGCDGFIGSHIALSLAEHGHAVVAGCQRDTSMYQDKERIDARVFDLCAPETMGSCLDGVECVVHAAAIFDLTKTYEEIRPVNVTGTENLLAAAEEHGVAKFIFFSTVEVYGVPQTIPITEDHPLDPGTVYGRTKVEGEAMVKARREAGKLETIVLRPSGVIGPRCVYAMGGLIPFLLMRAFGVKRLPSFRGDVRFNVVHVDDVVNFIRHVIETGRGWNSTYNMADSDIMSMERFFSIFYGQLGFRSLVKLPYPKRMLRGAGQIGRYVPLTVLLTPWLMLARRLWRRLVSKHNLEPVLTVPDADPCMLHFFRRAHLTSDGLMGTGRR